MVCLNLRLLFDLSVSPSYGHEQHNELVVLVHLNNDGNDSHVFRDLPLPQVRNAAPSQQPAHPLRNAHHLLLLCLHDVVSPCYHHMSKTPLSHKCVALELFSLIYVPAVPHMD